jgi:transcriptional regulator with XRE-family HTH domain
MKLLKLKPRFDASTDEANTATSTGQNAINSFDPTSTANTQQDSLGSSGLGGLLGGESNDYVSQYANAVANNPSVTSLYNTANQMFNVPQLANQSTYLNNQVTNAVPDAYTGAKGFDIDSTDINNGVAAKLSYLTPQANAATANYNTASGLASQYVQAGQAQNTQNLLPIQAQGTLLQQQEAAQATGWNQTLSDEFQSLIDKMNAGVQLSTTEMTRANTLASLEEAYNQAVTTANIGNQYKTLSPAQTLVNTMTGSTYKAK